MKKLFLAPALLLLGAASIGPVEGADPPGQAPLFPSQTFTNVAAPSPTFDLVQVVIEYAPGAVAALNSAQSLRFATVMSGELTYTIGNRTEVYSAGKSFVIPPGILAKGSNEGRATTARVFTSILQPAWASGGRGAVVVAETESSSNGPRILFASSVTMEDIPGVINVVQAGARLDPGYVFPTHVMNHPHNILHIEGTTSYEYVDGGRESYTAGQVGDMDVARPGTMANRGTTSSAYVMTWLQTPGTALTSPFTAPAGVTQTAIRPPSTGDAGFASAPDAAPAGRVFVAVSSALAGGAALWLVRRRARA